MKNSSGFFESNKLNKDNKEIKFPNFNKYQPSIEQENKHNIKIKNQNVRHNSPKKNFRYHASKNRSTSAQRGSMEDKNFAKFKENDSQERRESRRDISEENFSLKIYGASNLFKRQSNINHRSRSRNNGKVS